MGQSVQKSNEKKPSTVNDHIRELLIRLFVTAIAMCAAGTVVFFFYGTILSFLSSPLNAPLYYSSPAGSFSFVMKICLTGALIVTIPILIFNIIMFIRPAFEKAMSMKRILITTGISTALAVSGAAFAFYVILPGSLKFFKGFQVNGLHALISADSYLSFVTNMIIMLVVIFQIPLLMIFIDHLKPLKPTTLIKRGKWVVIGAVVIAIIQPFTYDFVTCVLIALPIVGLYYISVIGIIMQHIRESRKQARAIYAVVAKPVFSPANQLLVDDLLYESMLDDLSRLKNPEPIPARAYKPIAPLVDDPLIDLGKTAISPVQPVLPIRRVRPAHQEVAIPDWVLERKARQAQFSKKVNVFSDIIRDTGLSRA